MIDLKLTEEQLDELHKEASGNPCPRARKRCWVVYLKGKGYAHREIADVVRVDEDTVTEYVRKYRDGGLPGLLAEHYRKGEGQLDAHAERLKKVFENRPPHTLNQAIEGIERETGVRLKHSACRAFLRKLGMKCRRCGWVPGKALDDEKQLQAQQEFHDNKLQPRLEEAKQGRRTMLFVDAAHFVMGAFLGMRWCFVRQWLPSSCGRKRYNVLAAYDPIRQEAVTLTNDTVVNQVTFCALLDKIARCYAGTGLSITLILDNARDQKCQSVFDKATALGIELFYLPAYSPNLNLIERLWRFVKKQVLYSTHYDTFATFKESIDACLRDLGTRFKSKMQTLMTMNFQLFSKTENCTA
ncbi:MAG: IS630 family transposase [Accumulibacter sp.]|jgi:transposase|uniref:IS630 family transposase n=1 Tax=Accumulibacter sp. TaxID=2053492 RepID=UPI002FC3DE97